MLRAAFLFLAISIVAGIFGFTGVSAGAAVMAKVLFGVFFAMFLLLLTAGVLIQRKVLGKP